MRPVMMLNNIKKDIEDEIIYFSIKGKDRGNRDNWKVKHQVINGCISNYIVTLIIYIFNIRLRTGNDINSLRWYVIMPFFACVIEIILIMTVRGNKGFFDVREIVYCMINCISYLFLRNFIPSFMFLIFPIVKILLKRYDELNPEVLLFPLIYILIGFIPNPLPGEYYGKDGGTVSVILGIYLFVRLIHIIYITKNIYSRIYVIKEEEERDHNTFRKYLLWKDRQIKNYIQSVKGMAEMILRYNVPSFVSDRIINIMDAADSILKYSEGGIEESRLELTMGTEDDEFQESEGEYIQPPENREFLYAPRANVLIVEETEMGVNVFRALLKRTRVHIDSAYTGREALKLLSYNYYDIVIIANMISDMSGIQLMHLIREGYIVNENMVCIALCFNESFKTREMYKREGFKDVIGKPVSGRGLERLLELYLPSYCIGKKKTEDG
ncbi:MAG: response regulator [Lachnospiraceae bacterium]|nr:response regulator [Lachnospiraceae bacterium]